MKTKTRRPLLILVFALAFPLAARANPLWVPDLYMEGESDKVAWWIILVSLLVEMPFVMLVTRFSLAKAALVDIVMNLASAAAGSMVFGILLMTATKQTNGLAGDSIWHIRSYLHYPLAMDEGIIVIFPLILAATVAIEAGVVRLFLKRKLGWKNVLYLFIANLLTVPIGHAMALYDLWKFEELI